MRGEHAVGFVVERRARVPHERDAPRKDAATNVLLEVLEQGLAGVGAHRQARSIAPSSWKFQPGTATNAAMNRVEGAPHRRIIVALDVPDAASALPLAERL